MKLVLEAKPQGSVVDADDSADLDAGDAVHLVLRRTEARQHQVVAGGEPVDITAKEKPIQKKKRKNE